MPSQCEFRRDPGTSDILLRWVLGAPVIPVTIAGDMRMDKEILLVDPFRCRLWELHDRCDTNITEYSCRAEIESVARHGQIVPALGRRLQGSPGYDVELICGARRLFVARHIKRKLSVEVRVLCDREALILMDTENRQRTDISPYERGMSYARWLRSGNFQSQDDIVQTMNVSAAQVSRLIKLTRLPAVILDAFPSADEIHESWGLELLNALENPDRREATLKRARAICLHNPRPSAAEVYRQLLTPTDGRLRSKAGRRDEVVKDQRGRPLFRIRQLRNTIAVVLPLERVPASMLATIRETLSSMLIGAPDCKAVE
jgi:ParB/RepB/Spo0J family partition protein